MRSTEAVSDLQQRRHNRRKHRRKHGKSQQQEQAGESTPLSPAQQQALQQQQQHKLADEVTQLLSAHRAHSPIDLGHVANEVMRVTQYCTSAQPATLLLPSYPAAMAAVVMPFLAELAKLAKLGQLDMRTPHLGEGQQEQHGSCLRALARPPAAAARLYVLAAAVLDSHPTPDRDCMHAMLLLPMLSGVVRHAARLLQHARLSACLQPCGSNWHGTQCTGSTSSRSQQLAASRRLAPPRPRRRRPGIRCCRRWQPT
jgi:hypothetical protein